MPIAFAQFIFVSRMCIICRPIISITTTFRLFIVPINRVSFSLKSHVRNARFRITNFLIISLSTRLNSRELLWVQSKGQLTVELSSLGICFEYHWLCIELSDLRYCNDDQQKAIDFFTFDQSDSKQMINYIKII